MRFKTFLAVTCCAGAVATAPAAWAQAAAAGAAQDNAAATSDTTEQDVVVTGSRVIANGNNSPTPLTVVSAQEILTSQPSTISDALNNLPVFSAPRTQVSNPNTGIGAGGGGNSVANQLNLRNLLPQRTLILFDGHRVAPTTSTGIVDTDTIPQYLLKRVEVVTGGVSAVYGSDAVSGVVNFITDKDFNGLKANAQYGISDRADAPAWEAGIAFGTKIGDRAHFEASYEYRDDKGIDYRSSRPEFWRWTVQGNGTAATPFFLTGDAVRTDLSFGGVVRSGVLSGQEFKVNGVLSSRTLGTATSAPTIRISGDGAYFDGSLKASQRSHQVFGRFDFDVSDDIQFYVEGAANFKRNGIWGQQLTLTNVTLSRDNAFLASAYRDQLVNAGQSTFTYGKIITTAPRIRPIIDERQIFLNTGLDGDFGGGWKWSLGYVHSSSKLSNTEYNNVNNLKLAAALDAVVDPANGQVVCNVTLTNPGLYPGCVPLNVFGPTSESGAAIGYILDTTHFTAWTDQDDASASISGSPFATWAGDVRVALSGEWRRQSYRAVSDALTAAVGTAGCTGQRFNCVASTTQAWFQTFANRTPVSQTVTEGAVEVELPLLKGSAIAEELNLTGAARYTSYDTTGNYWTWKLGVDWHLTDALRFRATRSRDIRAPTLDDLFAPTTCFPANTTDLLTGLNSIAADCTTGNRNLTAEVGNTLTVGGVYKPGWLPGFSMSLDYYNIEIPNAITNLVGTNQTIQTACYASGGTSVYCSLQDRPLGYSNATAANAVTQWRRTVVNIAKVTTYGFDFEMNYATRLAGRPLALRTLVTYQPHIRFFQPGLPTLDMGGIAFGQNGTQASPKWRVTAFVNYSPTDFLTINVMERWRSALGITADPTQYAKGAATPAYATTNLNLSFKIPSGSHEAEFFVNVANLFDHIAPPANFGGSQGNIGLFGGFAIGDDPIGRYFTVGTRFKF
jgi:outer membrane receptor protein involved in Fe transport